jgi:ferredoxin
MVGSAPVKVAHIINEVDFIINLPKLKTHELMLFTGAIKNIFGLIPSINKVLFHTKFPDRNKLAGFFVDLEEAVKPQFHILDGIVSMEGPGPGNGFPKKTGILMASVNPLALDITACTIIGYDPMVIPTNRIAMERGKLLRNSDEIVYRGVNPETLLIKNFRKISGGGGAGIVMRYLKKKISFLRRFDKIPVFDPGLCTSCMKCVNVCPVEALTADKTKKNTILLDNKVCIRCYCCHELCRDRAIEIKRRFLFH